MAYDTDANGIPILEPQSLLSDVPAYTKALAPHITAVDTLLRQLMPLGTITPYYKSTAPNGMWLICNGTAVPADPKYNEYRSEIGPNTPDLQGRTLIGQSGTYAFGAADGASTHTLTVTEMPSHEHSINGISSAISGLHFHPHEGVVAAGQENYANRGYTTADPINHTGGGQAHNNMQPYRVVNYIILASYEA